MNNSQALALKAGLSGAVVIVLLAMYASPQAWTTRLTLTMLALVLVSDTRLAYWRAMALESKSRLVFHCLAEDDKPCPVCDGSGESRVSKSMRYPIHGEPFLAPVECPACKGWGIFNEQPTNNTGACDE